MMRLWRLIALPILLGFVFLGIYLYFYLGGNKPVEIDRVELPSRPTLYRTHRGAYHEINSVIVAVETWAKDHNISCRQTYGEYLDNPEQVEQGRLRSNAGCLLEGEPPNANDLPSDIKIGQIEAGSYLHAVFLGSPAIGPWKVYPKLKEFAQSNKLQLGDRALEFYTLLPENQIQTDYYLPLQR